MTDIVDRMNKWQDKRGFPTPGEILDEAAAEILRLRAEVKQHRMTRKERACCFDAAHDSNDNEALEVIMEYLSRTAPSAES